MSQERMPAVEDHARASSPPIERGGKLRYFALAAILVALDLVSKWWAFDVVELSERTPGGHAFEPVIPGFFDLVQVTNKGAVGSIGDNYRWPLVALRLTAVVVITVVLFRVARARWFLLTALSLVLAGALGNLYDNLFLGTGGLFLGAGGEPGEVRDFLSFDLSGIGIREIPRLVHAGKFNAFNFADSCIVCGAISLVLLSFAPARPREQLAPAERT